MEDYTNSRNLEYLLLRNERQDRKRKKKKKKKRKKKKKKKKNYVNLLRRSRLHLSKVELRELQQDRKFNKAKNLL